MSVIKTMSNARKRIKSLWWTSLVKRKCKSYGSNLKANGKTNVTRNTVLGNNVNFNGMKIVGGGEVKIGNYFHSGSDCLIISQNHNYEGTEIPYDSTNIVKEVFIEDFVWLGDRVIVLAGSHIGEGAIIQAGSVVCGDIPAYGIAGGHPARVFKYRDIDHFKSLKEQGKYH